MNFPHPSDNSALTSGLCRLTCPFGHVVSARNVTAKCKKTDDRTNIESKSL